MIARRAQDGTLTQADKRDHLEAATNILLSFYPGKKLLEEGKASDHYYGYLLQAGYLLQQGAIQPLENGRLHIDAERVQSASHELYRKLITFQSLGQRDESLALGVPSSTPYLKLSMLRFSRLKVNIVPTSSTTRWTF